MPRLPSAALALILGGCATPVQTLPVADPACDAAVRAQVAVLVAADRDRALRLVEEVDRLLAWAESDVPPTPDGLRARLAETALPHADRALLLELGADAAQLHRTYSLVRSVAAERALDVP
jgi:hypothetical protein